MNAAARSTRRRCTTTVVFTGLVLSLAVGCGSGRGDLLDPSALSAGTCRQAAAPVNVIYREVGKLQSSSDARVPAQPVLEKAQKQLITLRDSSSSNGKVDGTLDGLVQVVGRVRLGLVTKSYESELPKIDKAAEQLKSVCTAS